MVSGRFFTVNLTLIEKIFKRTGKKNDHVLNELILTESFRYYDVVVFYVTLFMNYNKQTFIMDIY